jgi:aminopeptidase
MSTIFDEQLEKYAEVIVRVGLNLQPGQRLLIGASGFLIRGVPLEAAQLVRKIAGKAYDAGAGYVDVIWRDGQVVAKRFEHAPPDSSDELPGWKVDQTIAYGKNGDALLLDLGEDPDLLAGLDPDSIQKVQGLIY